jgi:hypothetical protein
MKSSIEIDAIYAHQIHGAALSLGQLMIWTVYFNPKDFPGFFVARPTIIRPKTSGHVPMHLMARDLATLRTMLPGGLVRLERKPEDDPVIVEVWV